MQDKFESIGCLFGIAFLVFGLFQIYAAYIGLGNAIGWGWTVAAMFVAFIGRTSIPIVIGAFLCAKNVWEWHWTLAALFAAPGLIFILPSMVASLFDAIRARR